MQDSFGGVIAFAFMVAMILVGVVLRARFAFIQRTLVPASLLGGIIGFVLISLGWALGYQSQDFIVFAFHFFTLSFMSLVLTGRDSPGEPVRSGGLWLSVGWVMSLSLQALVGLTVVVIYNQVTGGALSEYLGLLVTHGFTQGPGQALAMGGIWEAEFQVSNAVSFGLIYASLGFVVCFLVGVPAARFAIARGMNANTIARLDAEFMRGVYAPEARPSSGKQVTHSANVDSLVFHLGLLAIAYIVTNAYLIAIRSQLGGVELLGISVEILFSHNLFFIHGLIVCLILRALMDWLNLGHYIDNETQKRITGSSVDLMMVATLMSIEFALLAANLTAILLVAVGAALVTGIMCLAFGRMLRTLPAERAITLFGCCTGSTGSGLLLLRIMDPDLSTSVARELAFFNIAIIFLSMHILMVMAPVLPSISLLVVCLVYGGTFLVGAMAWWFLSPRT